MSSETKTIDHPSACEVYEYVAEMCGELTSMVSGHSRVLSYLLDMARLEADSLVKASPRSRPR